MFCVGICLTLTARYRQHAQKQELLCLMSQGVQCNIVLLQSMQLLVVRTCVSPSDGFGCVREYTHHVVSYMVGVASLCKALLNQS